MAFRGRYPKRERNEAISGPANSFANDAAPPSYHLDIRRAVKTLLSDDTVRSLAVNDTLENIGLRLELLLLPLCDAADEVCYVPEGTKIDAERFRELVRKVIDGKSGVGAVNDAFVASFCQRVAPALSRQNGTRSGVAAAVTQQQQQQQGKGPSEGANARGAVGEPGDVPSARKMRFESSATGRQGPVSARGGGGAVLPTPHNTQRAHPFRSGPPPPPFAPSLAAQSSGALFAAPPVGNVRVVTFENLPPHLLSGEAMKFQIESLLSTIRHSYYLNYHVDAAFSLVIVSLNSVQAANELIVKIALAPKSAHDQHTIARPATPAEMETLWANQREELKVLEKQSQTAVSDYDQRSAGTQRALWHAASDAIKAVDEKLESMEAAAAAAAMSTDSSAGPQPVAAASTYKQERLVQLKLKLDARQQQDAATRALAAINQPLEGPLESYSSSSANVTHQNSLMFVSRLPGKMPDHKFLAFLQPLELDLQHVWRDPNVATTMCCELASAGAVFSVLRLLDANEGVFNGALFTRTKPQPAITSAN